VNWTVVGDFTGNCSAINPDDIQLQIVGTCGSKGTTSMTPDLFEDSNPYPLQGRKVRRRIKSGTVSCFAYRVQHNELTLEDPELEIIEF
jgi:hypothetical protein